MLALIAAVLTVVTAGITETVAASPARPGMTQPAYVRPPGGRPTTTPSTTSSTTRAAADEAALNALTLEIGKILTRRNVLLVWLFDESGSMRNWQKAIRDRVPQSLAAMERRLGATGPARLVSAVVGYGVARHFMLAEPTADTAKVQAAIDRLPIDTTGTENVMAACREAIRKYAPLAEADLRALAIVLVTDEEGSDLEALEGVVVAAKAARAAVFVLGGEAKFQKEIGWRFELSPAAPPGVRAGLEDKRSWLVPAAIDIGPESAFKETLHGHEYEGGPWWQPPWTMSGFGFWALSRLANQTGGVYYVLQGEKGPTYDPQVMVRYAPELCTAQEYLKRCKDDPIRGVIHWLHDLLKRVPLLDRVEAANPRAGFAAAREAALRRIANLDEIINILQRTSFADSPYAPRRWEANRELALADCYALRFSAHQFILAIDDFLAHPQWDPRAVAYLCASGMRDPLRGGEPAQEELKKVGEQYDLVAAHHAGTPWAFVAKQCRQLSRYGVRPSLPSTGAGGPAFKPPPPPPKL